VDALIQVNIARALVRQQTSGSKVNGVGFLGAAGNAWRIRLALQREPGMTQPPPAGGPHLRACGALKARSSFQAATYQMPGWLARQQPSTGVIRKAPVRENSRT